MLLEGFGLQRLDAQTLLGASHLVSVHQVGEVAQLVAERTDLTPHDRQRSLTFGTPPFSAGPLRSPLSERASHPRPRECRTATDCLCHRGLMLAPLSACCSPLTGCQLSAS